MVLVSPKMMSLAENHSIFMKTIALVVVVVVVRDLSASTITLEASEASSPLACEYCY
jgi:hypothetical protein